MARLVRASVLPPTVAIAVLRSVGGCSEGSPASPRPLDGPALQEIDASLEGGDADLRGDALVEAEAAEPRPSLDSAGSGPNAIPHDAIGAVVKAVP